MNEIDGNNNTKEEALNINEFGAELIVIMKPEAEIKISKEGISSAKEIDVSPLASLLENEEITLEPLFPSGNEDGKKQSPFISSNNFDDLNLSSYYYVKGENKQLDELAILFNKLENVESAYVKPASEVPQLGSTKTPNFVGRQNYLYQAPGGVDAPYAWMFPGGRGAGVRIIDLEWAWNFAHEDLIKNKYGVLIGDATGDDNHGTAVLGEFAGDYNTFGVTGISSHAKVGAAAFSMPTAMVIFFAANLLAAGDIMLLEVQRAGPRYNFQSRADQKGYIAIEWWPDDFAAIKYATSQGIIVVEAAGNGAENLDDPIYSVRPAGFPASWTNPFNRNNRDSQAIVVGAGAPPPGTHGNNWGPDRSRLDFSNYGSVIDAQGWGREVTSCGYGDLQDGSDRNRWYTDTFSGTSSASPIVVGVIACIQGILRAYGRKTLRPLSARNALRATGSPQQDAPTRPATQRIGNRPDIKQLIKYVFS